VEVGAVPPGFAAADRYDAAPVTAAALAAVVAATLLATEAPSPAPKAAGAKPARLTPGKPRSAPPPDPSLATTADRVAADRLLTEQKCTRCHDLSRALSTPLTESAWHAHLKRLGSGGAALSDEQVRRIRGYLKTAASAEKPPAPERAASR
jgi:hypothetical protein